MVYTTTHSDLRARKRFKKADFSKEFEEALEQGKSVHDFKGSFKGFLTKAAIKHKSTGVVHKGRVFWYNAKTKALITVYPLDRKWHKYIK